MFACGVSQHATCAALSLSAFGVHGLVLVAPSDDGSGESLASHPAYAVQNLANPLTTPTPHTIRCGWPTVGEQDIWKSLEAARLDPLV